MSIYFHSSFLFRKCVLFGGDPCFCNHQMSFVNIHGGKHDFSIIIKGNQFYHFHFNIIDKFRTRVQRCEITFQQTIQTNTQNAFGHKGNAILVFYFQLVWLFKIDLHVCRALSENSHWFSFCRQLHNYSPVQFLLLPFEQEMKYPAQLQNYRKKKHLPKVFF